MTSALTNQRRVFKACLTQTERISDDVTRKISPLDFKADLKLHDNPWRSNLKKYIYDPDPQTTPLRSHYEMIIKIKPDISIFGQNSATPVIVGRGPAELREAKKNGRRANITENNQLQPRGYRIHKPTISKIKEKAIKWFITRISSKIEMN